MKKVILPDGNEYYILEDPFKSRHLLLVQYYKNYPIKIGERYPCKIDKINCIGRIFIEPLHPKYTIGKHYTFKFNYPKTETNKKGEIFQYLIFTDLYQNKAYFLLNKPQANLEKIKACNQFKIKDISKGKIYLEL